MNVQKKFVTLVESSSIEIFVSWHPLTLLFLTSRRFYQFESIQSNVRDIGFSFTTMQAGRFWFELRENDLDGITRIVSVELIVSH